MTKGTEKNKKKWRNDLLFIGGLLFLLLAIGCGMFFLRGEGDAVTVAIDGALYGTYPLGVDVTVDIPLKAGESNRLVIQDGEAHMENANCPDGICAQHKPISRMGESIVCLPHRVVITVVGAADASDPDIVV